MTTAEPLSPDGASAVPVSRAAEIPDLSAFLKELHEPHVIRDLVSDWPLVAQGRRSRTAIAEYLQRFYSGDALITTTGAAEIGGRVGYNDAVTAFNFQRSQMQLSEFLQHIDRCAGDEAAPTLYIGSSLLDRWFPGLGDDNSLPLNRPGALASLWLGNRVVVSAHFDFPENLACCVAGRRRFTLLPPEQLENLYVGPWNMTPAGQPISLVDFRDPDLERFPRFAEAMAVCREVVLEPGDALYLPSMWWHHVEGLDDLNILLNYWWRDTPTYMGAPMNALKYAALSIRGLPAAQRRAWQGLFDYYIFDADPDAVAHIPEESRGIYGSMDDNLARSLRAELLNSLKR